MLPWWYLLPLGVAALFVLGGRDSTPGSSWHLLHHFYLGVSEEHIQGPPRFTQVGYVNDQFITRYDSNTRKVRPQGPWVEKAADPQFWEWETHFAQETEEFFRQDFLTLNSCYNHSGGLHTWQCLVGCELSKDETQKGSYMKCSYDGRDFISLDKETFTWTATDDAAQVTKRKWESDPDIAKRWKTYLEEKCIESLQKYLDSGKETLLRAEPPTVKVTCKVGPDDLETLACRAYGFYPKDIDATWRKDKEIWEQETFRGAVTPNSDGTYHTWLSIEIDPKERNLYQCHVEHDGLPEPLDLAWEQPASVPVGVIVAVVLVVVVAILLLAGIIGVIKVLNASVELCMSLCDILCQELSLLFLALTPHASPRKNPGSSHLP